MVCLVYVDDCLFFCRDPAKHKAMVKDLSKDMDLTTEGDVTSFLGIKIKKDDDGSFYLSQPGLIKRVIETTNLEDANVQYTPALAEPLGAAPEGEPPRKVGVIHQ